jgi:formate hydrogenlyase subunit 3/multisubunit Na+/H+ antiporter MnhD subunit
VTVAPLAILVPLLGAIVVSGTGPWLPRVVAWLLTVLTAAATAVLCAALVHKAGPGLLVVWFGGWHPRAGGVAFGIDLAIDHLGAGMALLAASLVTAAAVYAWGYLRDASPHFHALMLLFLAAMVGFCLTGDLFNLFVLFELLSVAAYAMTAYHVEEEGPLQGAINFAITNTIGGFMVLSGIGLLYGRTGALNMAQIGETLAGHSPDGLVVVAFVLIVCGFLIKAAAVPFHLWLADAHAVAPVPLCVLFSGVMVQIGLYAIARVYWTVFSGMPEMRGHTLVQLVVGLGAITAVFGAVMCWLQRHLKRLLAFSTISHTGLFLVGIGLLSPGGLAAAGLFIACHGLIKGSLFMGAGIVGKRLGTVDTGAGFGLGRQLTATRWLFAGGALLLASLPPFGPFAGKALVEEAATKGGFWCADGGCDPARGRPDLLGYGQRALAGGWARGRQRRGHRRGARGRRAVRSHAVAAVAAGMDAARRRRRAAADRRRAPLVRACGRPHGRPRDVRLARAARHATHVPAAARQRPPHQLVRLRDRVGRGHGRRRSARDVRARRQDAGASSGRAARRPQWPRRRLRRLPGGRHRADRRPDRAGRHMTQKGQSVLRHG